MPATSVIWLRQRRPSRIRLSCTITSTAEAICCRIDSTGKSAAICTSTSSRKMTSIRVVGVDRGERAIVAGVHRLQHVEGFGPAAFADDDPIGPHAEGIFHEVADRVFAGPFDVGGLRFQPHDVLFGELQLGRVFDRDDPLLIGNEIAEAIEQRRFAGARAAGDQDVFPSEHRGPQELGDRARHRPLGNEVVDDHLPLGKFADRERWAADRERAITAFTRLPSERRASTSGCERSMRRPTLATIR